MLCVKEIKQTLREAREMGLKYIRLRNKARSFEQRLMGGKTLRFDYDGGTHEHNGNSVERSLCAAADYQEEVDKAAHDLSEPYLKASRLIYLVKDGKLRDILNRYYLYGQSWERIAADMGCSERWVKKLNGDALKKISEST